MRKILEIESGGYYLIESLAVARSCYFESKEEAERFKSLFNRYLHDYVEVHKIFVSSAGYQILIKIRGLEVLRKIYRSVCEKKERPIKEVFIKEPWRIVSEQIRIFHSVYAKWVNRKRERSGGLVKERYGRYFFEGKVEFDKYISDMDRGKEIESQKNDRYKVSKRWKKGIEWGVLRGVDWVESLMSIRFKNYVVGNLLKYTVIIHTPPP